MLLANSSEDRVMWLISIRIELHIKEFCILVWAGCRVGALVRGIVAYQYPDHQMTNIGSHPVKQSVSRWSELLKHGYIVLPWTHLKSNGCFQPGKIPLVGIHHWGHRVSRSCILQMLSTIGLEEDGVKWGYCGAQSDNKDCKVKLRRGLNYTPR